MLDRGGLGQLGEHFLLLSWVAVRCAMQNDSCFGSRCLLGSLPPGMLPRFSSDES